MNQLSKAWHYGAELGLPWLVHRLQHEAALRTGALERRLPRAAWDEVELPKEASERVRANLSRLIFSTAGEEVARQWPAPDRELVAVVHALSAGRIRFFGGHEIDVGLPPRWHRNWQTSHEYPADVHWSRVPEFALGDVKYAWELARFGWAFSIARLYARSGDNALRSLFFELLVSWMGSSPPNTGVHWRCGQEASLRLIALVFCFSVLVEKGEVSESQLEALGRIAVVTGARIEATIGFAVRQHNNHGLTEAAGLITAGAIVNGMKPAAAWLENGVGILHTQIFDLFQPDGSFSQYSVNYHRHALQVCLWATVVMRAWGHEPVPEVLERLRAASTWLSALMDPDTGQTPRFGQHDGSHPLPLAPGGVEDFRPTVQASAAVLGGARILENGPWDEAGVWLTGTLDASPPIRQRIGRSKVFPDSGYVVLRDDESRAFSRCGVFRFRPSQADLLHLDLSWRGHRVALDPGTYSYNAPDPWSNPFAETRYHNTVEVDGENQMRRVSRFLWGGRPDSGSQLVSREPPIWEAWHAGYVRRPGRAIHRRSVASVGAGRWLVVDRVTARRDVRVRLHWLLADVPYTKDGPGQKIRFEFEGGSFSLAIGSSLQDCAFSVVRADEESPRGWWSPAYGVRKPAISAVVEASADNMVLASAFGPGDLTVSLDGDELSVLGASWGLNARLGSGAGPLIQKLSLDDWTDSCTAC